MYKLLPARRSGELVLSGHWDYAQERDVDWVAGSFMMLPREVFDQTGGFDERMFMYGEDLEWCYRIRDYPHDIEISFEAFARQSIRHQLNLPA